MMTEETDQKRSVSTKEAAKLAGVSVDTIYKWINAGKLPSAQPGSTGKHKRGGAPHRIYVSDLEELMRARKRGSQEGGGADGER